MTSLACNNEHCKRSIGAILVALALIVPIHNLSATEITLLCRNPRLTGVIALVVNTGNNSVHSGSDPNQGWFRNETYKYKDDDGCVYNRKAYVRIYENKIEFGSDDTGPPCIALGYHNTLDRVTGELKTDSGQSLECEESAPHRF
jgi:hypothetical protein